MWSFVTAVGKVCLLCKGGDVLWAKQVTNKTYLCRWDTILYWVAIAWSILGSSFCWRMSPSSCGSALGKEPDSHNLMCLCWGMTLALKDMSTFTPEQWMPKEQLSCGLSPNYAAILGWRECPMHHWEEGGWLGLNMVRSKSSCIPITLCPVYMYIQYYVSSRSGYTISWVWVPASTCGSRMWI